MVQLTTHIITINIVRVTQQVILICTPGTKRCEIRKYVAQILRKQNKMTVQKSNSQEPMAVDNTHVTC